MHTIILDPGHGGSDPGAVLGTRQEKDDTLRFALALKAAFTAQGVNVLMTRESDVNPTLSERCGIDNNTTSSAFISCHRDAASTSAATGATVWLHHSAIQSYRDWAKDVISGIEAVGLTSNRFTKINLGYPGNPQADYYINRNTNGPSMLLELGFITSPTNNAEFNKNYLAYAEAVCKATCRFIGVPYIPPTEEPPEQNPSEETDKPCQECNRQRDKLLAELQQIIDQYKGD